MDLRDATDAHCEAQLNEPRHGGTGNNVNFLYLCNL